MRVAPGLLTEDVGDPHFRANLSVRDYAQARSETLTPAVSELRSTPLLATEIRMEKPDNYSVGMARKNLLSH